MSPSKTVRGLPEDHGFPTTQLLALALCRLAEPIAFVSIMSYSFDMVKTFPGIDDTTASFYAGLLISAFAVAEACTAMVWGSISDRYGRKPIILAGLAGTAISSLVFGFAKNIWLALAARIIGGLLNGNVAVMQTMVSEIAYRPEYEPKAYAMPGFVWSFGSIIGSAMGGYLAEPARYYPSLFSQSGIFGQYPYLLPNFVAVVAIFLAILQGLMFLKETNPRSKVSKSRSNGPTNARTPLLNRQRRATPKDDSRRPSFMSASMPTFNDPTFDLRRSSINTLRITHDIKITSEQHEHAIEDDDDGHPDDSVSVKAFSRAVIALIIALVIMSYHQMAFVSLLSTYFLDLPHDSSKMDLQGGLGYNVHDVGTFMSVNGIIALAVQVFIFPPFVSRVGVWKSLIWLTILCPITYILVPLVGFLPRSYLPIGIYALLALQNFFVIITYPCVLIALKNATASSLVLGRVNGLAMSACCGARTIAPPLEGFIYGKGGSAAAWWSIAGVGFVGAAQLCFVSRPKEETDVTIVNVFTEEEGEVAVTTECLAVPGPGGLLDPQVLS